MGENTNISWTDSTFNPWWGCSKVSPGCDFCYAEILDRRTGRDSWGPRKTPRILSEDNWRKPLRWQKSHVAFEKEHDHRHRVFTGSMCDWADRNAPADQRSRLWTLIQHTPALDWQLLTKRAPNIKSCLPTDWGNGYANVWLGVTAEDREHGLPRIDVLRQVPAKLRFLSVEPLLEDLGELNLNGINWVIVGGESGPGCRQIDLRWVENIRQQCEAQEVPFFYKQRGGHPNKYDCQLDGIEIKQWPRRFHTEEPFAGGRAINCTT